MQPGADFRGHALFKAAASRPAPRFLRRDFRDQQQDRHTAAENFEEVAAVEIKMVREVSPELVALGLNLELHGLRAHDFSFAIASAARSMASMIRGYVPQRQIFPFMKRRISSSLGRGFARKSADALTIIPEVQ